MDRYVSPPPAVRVDGTAICGNYCGWFFLLILSVILLFTLRRFGHQKRGWLLLAWSYLLRPRSHQTGARASAYLRVVRMGWRTGSYWSPAARSGAIEAGGRQSCQRSLQIDPTHYKDPRRRLVDGRNFTFTHIAFAIKTDAAAFAVDTGDIASFWSWWCLPDSFRAKANREWIEAM